MEPPAKKLRRSRPDNAEDPNSSILLASSTHAPTRTIDLADFDHKSIMIQGRGYQPRRRSIPSYLVARAPDPTETVTQNVVEVAIIDETSTSQSTQVPAPSSDAVMIISDLGSVTVPGVSQVTSVAGSLLTDVSSSLSYTSGSATGSLVSSLTSGLNTTTSAQHTITVTSTSTFSVSYRNGTFIPITHTANHNHTTTIEGVVTTTYDGSSSDSTSDPSSDLLSSTGGMLSSHKATTTAYDGIGSQVPSRTSSSSSSTSTDSDSGGGSPGIILSPQQQQVVGGVVGGIAGIAFVLFALLYFLRWYRQRLKVKGFLPEQANGHRGVGNAEKRAITNQGEFNQPYRGSLFPAAALGTKLKQLRPHSTWTITSNTTTASSLVPPESERSFQRIAGRKIPSVLSAGGDGFGDGYGVFDHCPATPPFGATISPRAFSQTSCYRDSNDSCDEKGRPASRSEPGTPIVNPFFDPPSPPSGTHDHTIPSTSSTSLSPLSRDFAALAKSRSHVSHGGGSIGFPSPFSRAEGWATLAPSPARTPIIQSPPNSSSIPAAAFSTPPIMHGDIPDMPAPPILKFPPKRKKDAVGRSLADEKSHADKSTSHLLASDGANRRSVSGRSRTSVGGRFREGIS